MADPQFVTYTPQYQPPTWRDDVDVVAAEGSDGFNAQFQSLRGELNTLSQVVQQLSSMITSLSQTANIANTAVSGTSTNALAAGVTLGNALLSKRWAYIQQDGNFLSGGKNLRVVQVGIGLYDIFFQPAFLVLPTVQVTQIFNGNPGYEGGSTRDNAVVIGITTRQCRIKTGNGDGVENNRAFGFLAYSAVAAAMPVPGAIGAWLIVTSMRTLRYCNTATMLFNGKVLVSGGENSNNPVSSAEIYDPTSGTWKATGNMNTARAYHRAVLLSNNKVLVSGGSRLKSAELYDPANDSWKVTGSMSTARTNHTATLLRNGKVLVVGGSDANDNLSSAEIYDPATETWKATANMNAARAYHTTSLLANDKILVAGGSGVNGTLNSAELYDPASDTWTVTSGNMQAARTYHTASILPNGNVLVAGGIDTSNASLASAELYDATAGTWTAVGSMSNVRMFHTASVLSNGKVLVAGGFNSSMTALASVELYDPSGGTWVDAGSMNNIRAHHAACVLSGDQVLALGGAKGQTDSALAEIWAYTTYQAGSADNSLANGAVISPASGCASNQCVTGIGNGPGTLIFNKVNVRSAGTYTLTISYIAADAGRDASMSINGGAGTTLRFPGNNSNNWQVPNIPSLTVPVTLNAGDNTIAFSNTTAAAPAFDKIAIS